MVTLTKQQARTFLLYKHGLLGEYRFRGKEGILEYIRQTGSIQFDPIDVCGKNAELVLQSRIQGFNKKMLYELLYDERKLMDYFDKCLCILPIEDWPYLERIRRGYREWGRGKDEVDRVAAKIKDMIRSMGPVSSKDIGLHEKVDWYWSSSKLARVALESLYFRGDLIIHHKKGTNKYYALAEDYLPKELLMMKDPYPSEMDHLKWRIQRRISAVGLLWNRPSDAWIYIWDLKAQNRKKAFDELLAEDKLIPITIEGCKDTFYCVREDEWLLNDVLQEVKLKSRTELLAPLDCMLWDRKLIKELFDFDYKWEIYTPEKDRKYGYYVLPVLMGDRLVARVEVVAYYKKKTLVVKNVWPEKGIRPTKKFCGELDRCFRRFMKFNQCTEIVYETDAPGANTSGQFGE
jgi:uncharacterized protein